MTPLFIHVYRQRVQRVALALLLALAGCTQGGGRLAHDPSTLVIATLEEPDSIDPLYANLAAANDAITLAYDGLVMFGPDGTILPDLASAVPSRENGGVSADGRTIVYHLRRGVRWQDGAPFTARDVIFTWRSIMDPHANVPTHAGYDCIESIDAPGPRTVRVHLRAPYAPALSLFARGRQGAIVPAHRTPGFVGTGPYRILRWTRGDRIVYERNPYYRPLPIFARVELRFMPDEQTIVNALRTGEADAGLYLTAPTLALLQHDPSLRLSSASTFEWEHLSFNLRPGSGPQTNVHVRRAIAYAIDPVAMRAHAFGGLGGLAPLDQAPDSWARDALVHYYRFDRDAARRELRAAGLRHVAITLVSTTGNSERYRLEIALQAACAAAGIEVSIKNIPPNLLLARSIDRGLLMSGHFEVALFSFVAISPDPDDARFVSSRAIPPNGVNLSAYANRPVDRLIEQAQSTYDRRERTLLYARVQQHLIQDLPFYTLLWSPVAIVSRPELRGPRAVPVGSMLWNVSTWHRTGP